MGESLPLMASLVTCARKPSVLLDSSEGFLSTSASDFKKTQYYLYVTWMSKMSCLCIIHIMIRKLQDEQYNTAMQMIDTSYVLTYKYLHSVI